MPPFTISPLLPSIDSEAVARRRDYGAADPAPAVTVALPRGLDAGQFGGRATFEECGPVSRGARVPYLCGHDQQHLAGPRWLLGKVDVAKAGA